MNFVRGLATTAAMSVALAASACAPPRAEGNPELEPAALAVRDLPEVSAPNYDDLPNETQRLVLADADVQIIYVETAESEPVDPAFQETADTNLSLLLNNDAAYTQNFLSELGRMTSGRYTPEKLTVTKAPELDTGSVCFDESTQAVDQVREHVTDLEDPSMLRVILLGQGFCHADTLGVAPLGGIPILSHEANAKLPGIVGHEGLGHDAEQAHDSIDDCVNVPPLDCTPSTSTAQEEYSIMSPKMGWKPNHFTTPGLERLALLEDSEILEDPAPGTYTLGRATDLEPTVPKLITFNEGEMAISLEGEGANCGRVLSSVQVRRRTEIVTDGSTLVGSNLMKPDDGNTCIETPAGEVVYRDDARTVTVVQLDADKALLSVS